jgi:hypothetical protein
MCVCVCVCVCVSEYIRREAGAETDLPLGSPPLDDLNATLN